jgi:mannitol-1-phosphate/altronate dehydrogenase
LKGKTNNKLSAEEEEEEEEDKDVELVVRYKNDKVREDLKLIANDGMVKKGIKRFKLATLTTKHCNIYKIEKDCNIEAVAVSITYQALPYTCGGQAQDEHNLSTADSENFPYGIGLVQADQVGQGSSLVKVCVVDTALLDMAWDTPTCQTSPVMASTDTALTVLTTIGM